VVVALGSEGEPAGEGSDGRRRARDGGVVGGRAVAVALEPRRRSVAQGWSPAGGADGAGGVERGRPFHPVEHRVEVALGGDLVGDDGLLDAVEAKGAAGVAEPAPADEVAGAGREVQSVGLDGAGGRRALAVAVDQLDDPPADDGPFDVGDDLAVGARSVRRHRADAGGQLLRLVDVRAPHGGQQLLLGATAGGGEGVVGQHRQRRHHGHRLGRLEVERRQGRRLLDGVAAEAPPLRPDGHAGLLEGEDVALDRAGADLEAVGQFLAGHDAGRPGAQLLDQCVQPVAAAHPSPPSVSIGAQPDR
jgi:hypothetical protein